MTATDQALLAPLLDIARAASARILEIYETDFDVTRKDDASPLTAADMASHKTICAGLSALTPDIPILSEESADVPFATRRHWSSYWLVDPLDGTKEFIKRNGEFTVNIALIQDHAPVVGVVHVPVTGVSYLGCAGVGAFRQTLDGEPTPIRINTPSADPVRVVGSRSHRGEALDAYLARLGAHEIVPMGSSLKICLVAEGKADVYPRLGPTSEWDTAAAHAVLAAAGGKLIDTDGQPLRYNTRESLLNPWFIACGDSARDWTAYLG